MDFLRSFDLMDKISSRIYSTEHECARRQRKSWVISTQIWVKYGQTQMLG